MRRHAVFAVVALAGVLGGVELTARAVDHPLRPASAVVARDAAPVAAVGTTAVVRLQYSGLARSYRLFVPTQLPPGPRPLLVALHGYTGTAAAFEKSTRLDQAAGASGTLVAYPQGSSRSWDAGTCCGRAAADGVDDVGFISAVIDDVSAKFAVDPRRIAVAGFSNGGMMAYRYACARADRISAAVVMSGTLVAPACTPSRPVSLLHVHGLADVTVPFAGVSRTPLDRSGFAGAQRVVASWGRLDGCGGWSTSSTRVTTVEAVGCRAGSRVRLVTSASLGHRWPVGTGDEARYGIDMTASTWTFLADVWR
jgi:polyhydroxybutyrate depolymerase